MSVVERIVELIRETSTSLPEDVERALRRARRAERKGGPAEAVLGTILDNVRLARRQGTPLCQDTGTLTFFVDERLRRKVTPSLIRRAVARATELGLLRKNALDSVTGQSYDDNCAPAGAPVIHYFASGSRSSSRVDPPSITLLMKGGGSENMSRQYSLPDATLGAGRDLKGVRACVLDAVQKAQGYGCAPGILGVSIGGDRATGYEVAKMQLLRPLDGDAVSHRVYGDGDGDAVSHRVYGDGDGDAVSHRVYGDGDAVSHRVYGDAESSPRQLRQLETELLRDANSLGIGPMGLGGKTTLLGVKIAACARVPASFFVTVAYMCWAARRRTVFFD